MASSRDNPILKRVKESRRKRVSKLDKKCMLGIHINDKAYTCGSPAIYLVDGVIPVCEECMDAAKSPRIKFEQYFTKKLIINGRYSPPKKEKEWKHGK